MKSGLYANLKSMTLVDVVVYKTSAAVYMLNNKKNRPYLLLGVYTTKWLKQYGPNIVYIGKV